MLNKRQFPPMFSSRRPSFILILLCLLQASFVTSCGTSNNIKGDPDLIYILTIDSLRSDLIGLSFRDQQITPQLNTFARDSVFFENAYAQAPFTKISVASMFTGLWPSRLGVKQCRLHIFPKGVELCRGLDFRFPTLAEYLRSRGYATYTSLFTAHVRKGDGLIQGFDYQEKKLPEEIETSQKTFVYDHIIGLHAPYNPSPKARDRLQLLPTTPERIDPGNKDWFWEPLEEGQDQTLYESYLAEGLDADAQFGELRAKLEESDLWDRALIIVTADHGEEFLEHGGTQHSAQLYDEVLRVPLFVKFPQHSPLAKHHGATRTERVRLVDIFPTLTEFLGTEAPEAIDGKSLVPLIRGLEANRSPRPVLAYTSVSRPHQGATMSFESEMYLAQNIKVIRGYRTEDSQTPLFPHHRADEIAEMFDLDQDPAEQLNLAKDNPQLFRKMWKQHSEILQTGQPDLLQNERSEREEQLRSLGYIQ